MNTARNEPLLSWQWALYADGHRDRRNLLVHVLTVPVFMLGSAMVVLAPWLGLLAAAGGFAAMAVAMGLQGAMHRRETTPPAPFHGGLDVVSRILAEQWITFPRYVLSGGWLRAWRAAADES